MFTVGIITASDKGSMGERKDESGPAIKNFINNMGGIVKQYHIVPDDKEALISEMIQMCDNEKLDLVLTTGGTGFSKRDITPEATLAIIQRHIPGFTELIRLKSFDKNPRAILSRAVSGIRKETIIINLPGSPRGALEALEIIQPALVHGIEILKGTAIECGNSHQQ
ncbi:MogA/MoaB family molybdenum cofactor biosynthesis protein [Tindallia californiensis]|uniref:Molybdenum cofactor biosynthesis protein B n=1 Tax=Tindallia californiensis TaxID=159292 RepID=A0A1H3NAV1_9FIRM|nr:MogA/MoaB family molybdenum cofactor biosynthesis protein [Tindallia californiensis]SDY85605.1 molybdenum cofactor synthesis domain-containing protein [Tindallia californiensis]